jgi:hypothetical protein
VAIPVFRAGELPELRFGECSCVRHVVPLSLKCPPRRGREQAQCSRDKRGSHSFLGGPRQRSGGAKTASLTASDGAKVTAPRRVLGHTKKADAEHSTQSAPEEIQTRKPQAISRNSGSRGGVPTQASALIGARVSVP